MAESDIKQVRREAAAQALARGLSIKTAAGDVGISERCLHNWFRQPKFKARVHELQNEAFENAGRLLTSMSTKACYRLYQLVDSGNESVALGASKAILENATRMREILHLSREQAEIRTLLEKFLHGNQPNAK
jgi:transposase-like protein